LQSSDVICTMTAYNILIKRRCLILLHIYTQLKSFTVSCLSHFFKTLLFQYFLNNNFPLYHLLHFQHFSIYIYIYICLYIYIYIYIDTHIKYVLIVIYICNVFTDVKQEISYLQQLGFPAYSFVMAWWWLSYEPKLVANKTCWMTCWVQL
jgi:hypothetical protein